MSLLGTLRNWTARLRQRRGRIRARVRARAKYLLARRQWLEDRLVLYQLARRGRAAPRPASPLLAVRVPRDAAAVERLAALLGGSWSEECAVAADALGRSHDPRALDALARATRAADWRIRWCGVVGLGWTGDEQAVQPLIGALKDPQMWVRQRAARSLGLLGSLAAPALGPLRDGLRRRTRRGRPYPGVRSAFRVAIRRIEAAGADGPPELIAALPPEGTGTEPEAAPAPAGRGTEPLAALEAAPPGADAEGEGLRSSRVPEAREG